eukprot:TRINITY_DN11034_c0_g1_i1.p1 TRINITY_DN11034_c0_g1~~TRINITY_DN11034_c0_g1_i1.p1  ORF type:complete len:458 (-),score=-19.60 TRINITY_DN11034_c0_g1_i1:308-1681(-)
MKTSILALTFLLPAAAFSQEAVQKSVSVTVYNDNLGIVKEKREVNLKKGVSDIQLTDVPTMINPATVHMNFNGSVMEQNYRYDLANLTKILEKYIDKEVTLISPEKSYTGNLISVSELQIVLKKAEGGLIMIPNIEKYQLSVDKLPEGFITKPTLVWTVSSNASGKSDIDISYQTGGMSWNADYVAVLNKDDSKIDINSWVSVTNNSGVAFKDANLKLIAGEVNRAPITNLKGPAKRSSGILEVCGSDIKFDEKSFFDYHLYELDKPATLANNEQKQLALFTAKQVPVQKKYKATTYFSEYSGNEMDLPVNVAVEFVNSEKNNMGMPLPEGIFRVNKNDGTTEEFVGEDRITHTPRNEKVTLNIGKAFDLKVKATTKDKKDISKKVSEYTCDFSVANRKEKEDAVIEVEETFYGTEIEILSCNVKYEKISASKFVFKVPVAKDSETTVNYKVRLKKY